MRGRDRVGQNGELGMNSIDQKKLEQEIVESLMSKEDVSRAIEVEKLLLIEL